MSFTPTIVPMPAISPCSPELSISLTTASATVSTWIGGIDAKFASDSVKGGKKPLRLGRRAPNVGDMALIVLSALAKDAAFNGEGNRFWMPAEKSKSVAGKVESGRM